jgi:hypothetical protein
MRIRTARRLVFVRFDHINTRLVNHLASVQM